MKLAILPKLCVVVACCAIATTTVSAQHRDDSRNAKNRDVKHASEGKRADDGDSYFERRGYTRLNIPKGHYPPPGECRIWYPDRPAGHQPPPMSCAQARAQVPRGAWVIQHPENDHEHVHVAVYDERRPGSILVIGQFKIATGVFVRVVVNR